MTANSFLLCLLSNSLQKTLSKRKELSTAASSLAGDKIKRRRIVYQAIKAAHFEKVRRKRTPSVLSL